MVGMIRYVMNVNQYLLKEPILGQIGALANWSTTSSEVPLQILKSLKEKKGTFSIKKGE